MKLKLNNVRLAFPALFEAKTVNGEGKPAFSAVFLLSPNDKQVKTIEAAIEAAATEKWAAKAPAMLKQIRAGDKTFLHDGDMKASYDGFEGHVYVSARNEVRPLVIDADKTPLVAADGKPYAGCYVNATLDVWAMDNNYGKRVCATLTGVQFLRDGDSFAGGRSASEDDFDDVSEGADADALA
jgi:hypothetical protein